MSKTAVAIRHVAFEDLGIWEPLLARRGYEVRYLDAGVDELAGAAPRDADLLIVLGGPIGVDDEPLYPFLADERRLLEQRLARRRPTLGICLGAQLIARALGARVYPAREKEIGWAPLALTSAGARSPLAALGAAPGEVLHWHGDTFDLPAGAAHLASTEVCPHQAFSVDAALALQFHLEVDVRRIERWLIGHTCELGANRIDIAHLRRRSLQLGPARRPAFEAVLESWLDEQGEQT